MNAACLMCYRQDVARHLTSVKSWKQTKEFADSILKIKANQLLRIHRKLIQQDVGLMCSGLHHRKTEIIGTLTRTAPTFANANAFRVLLKVWITYPARYHAGIIFCVIWEPAFRFIEKIIFESRALIKKKLFGEPCFVYYRSTSTGTLQNMMSSDKSVRNEGIIHSVIVP